MKKNIVALCKVLRRIIAGYYTRFDPETSDLMAALAAYVEKNGD